MENQELLAGMGSLNSIVASDGDGLEHMSNGVKETENLGDHLLEDLDLYLEDINDRLTISRMVSDSVIRGMVNAVEQEASDKISAKDSELNCLKKNLYINQGAVDKIKYSGLPVAYYQPRNAENGRSCSFSGYFWEHDNMRGSLSNIRSVAWEQIKKLKKEIDGIRGCNSIRRNSSGSELIGLGGILQEKVSESWVGIDKTLDALKNTVDTICMQVDDVLQLDKASLCEWRQEQEFQGEIEAIVIRTCIRSLQEEFEEKLWDQNARFCSIQSVNWHEKISKMASLHKELDAVLKSLPGPETGQLISHGSYDADHFNRKALSNQVSSSNSLWEGNGKLDESKANMPENLDAAQLKHMSKEEMVNYFNQMITEMKRNHESTLQGMIEENFALKREHLRNRGKFDILRRKIPDAMLKLDSILVENEKLPLFTGNSDGLGSLRGQLENLILENKQLRDSLMDKKKEVKYLSAKVSDAAEKMLQHSSTEMQLLQLIGNLKSSVEDASIEASVSEEVYKCILREVSVPINHCTKESELQSLFMKDLYEVILGEAAHSAEVNSKCEIEDSDIESLIMEGLCGVVYKGAIEDARSQLNHLNTKYLGEIENRASFEMNALKTEEELMQEVKEKERLKQEVLLLEALVTEKEKIANEVSAAFEEEKKQFKLASQELQNLRDESSLQKTLISDYKKELESVKGDLVQALGQIEAYKLEAKKLSQKLELTLKEFVEADEERNMLQSVTQEKQNDLLVFQLKEKEQRKQMQEIIVLVHGLSKTLADFEFRVAEGIERNNLRLEFSGSQMSSLIQKANAVTKTHFVYKQRLEKRCSDLQMAEAEVDLLGDEVDALLSLLEKIYIALDHYSPVLQHYPGIIEILKLVRRELSGESTKPV